MLLLGVKFGGSDQYKAGMDASTLQPLLNTNPYYYLEGILKGDCLHSLSGFLKGIESNGISILGPEGSVINPAYLAKLLDNYLSGNSYTSSNLFPETLGIRDFVIKHCKVISPSEFFHGE